MTFLPSGPRRPARGVDPGPVRADARAPHPPGSPAGPENPRALGQLVEEVQRRARDVAPQEPGVSDDLPHSLELPSHSGVQLLDLRRKLRGIRGDAAPQGETPGLAPRAHDRRDAPGPGLPHRPEEERTDLARLPRELP